MPSWRDRLATLNRRLPSWLWPVVIIAAAVGLANVMYTAGLADNNPISYTSGIAKTLCRITCGRPAIDPNIGFITQPLGHLSAMDLLHGHLPWWNYFEGLGSPLAGEMQAASLFPLTLLFALPAGLLFFHLSLEIIAGVGTYFLGRRLGMPSVVATGIGVVFALNGTFAWLGNAVLNPIAFLPLMVLGVEMIYGDIDQPRRRGWYVLAVALALSIYAGFPEVAFLDGLFVLVWAIVRVFALPRVRRWRGVRRVAYGGGLGILLALPITVAFLDYLKVADIGGHVGARDGAAVLPHSSLPMFLDPYIYGTIFSNHNPGAVNSWGSIGGYLLAGTTTLALLGLFGRRLRPLRLALAGWFVMSLGAMFNVLHIRQLWNVIPYVKQIAFSRYDMATLEFTVVVLAGLAISDLATTRSARRLFFITTPLGGLLLLWSALSASNVNAGYVLTHRVRIIFLGLHALPFVAVVLILGAGFLTRFRWAPLVLVTLLAGEAAIIYFVPTAEAPKQVNLDTGPITYLQQNIGRGRFLDFEIIYPNWGSQFNLPELNAIDLPFPTTFATYIADELNPGITPSRQFMASGGMTGILQQEHALLAHLAAYRAAGVQFLIFPVKVPLLPALTKLGVQKVFANETVGIYSFPGSTNYFSSPTSGCQVTGTGFAHATATCTTAGTVVRSELMMPGWHATVNGQSVPITTVDGVYQSVDVPAGTSSLAFTFLPPHELAAAAGFALGILLMIGLPVGDLWLRRRRRPRHAPRHAARSGSGR